jgi:signal transduction histidine kinase
MLDLSKLEGGLDIEFSLVAFEEVARISVEAHQWPASKRGVSLELVVPDALPKARGNPEWLRQVFDNLISNAIKFTSSGGSVTVSVSNKGECLMASVVDTGIGIPKKDQGRVFEKFYQASNREAASAAGTGLGLAICRTVMDKHEGRIWVESEEGQGAAFHFMVPVARAGSSVGEEKT